MRILTVEWNFEQNKINLYDDDDVDVDDEEEEEEEDMTTTTLIIMMMKVVYVPDLWTTSGV